MVDIIVDEAGQFLVEWKLQIDPVLHVIVGEHQHVRGLWSARLDEILIQPDLNQVAQADGGVREDGDGDRKLGGHSGLDRRLIPPQPRLRH